MTAFGSLLLESTASKETRSALNPLTGEQISRMSSLLRSKEPTSAMGSRVASVTSSTHSTALEVIASKGARRNQR